MQKLRNLSPKQLDARNWLKQGMLELGNGRYTPAENAFNKAIESDSKHVAAYYNRGIATYYQKNHMQAVADFRKTLELEPGHYGADRWLRTLVPQAKK